MNLQWPWLVALTLGALVSVHVPQNLRLIPTQDATITVSIAMLQATSQTLNKSIQKKTALQCFDEKP